MKKEILEKIQYEKQRIIKRFASNLNRVIFVSVNEQKLYLFNKKGFKKKYRMSASKYGIGSKKGSFKTPLGIHKIYKKIGHKALPYTVFKDRENTGEIWDGKSHYGYLILSRIIWLEGLEKEINKGKDIDTRDRYIYIHGTNHENLIGAPSSHGCIIMKNHDIIELFDLINEGDVVDIF